MLGTVEPTSVIGVIFGAFGVLSLIATGAVVVFGTRSRTVATQQDQAIGALEGRVTALESENKELKTKNRQLDAEFKEAQTKVEALGQVVTAQAEIQELALKNTVEHEAILAAIAKVKL